MAYSSPNFKHYHYVNHGFQKKEQGDLLEKATYRFTSTISKRKYIVEVEKYKHDTFVLKFFLKGHRFSQNKYNLLTGLKEPRMVTNTCIAILLEIFTNNNQSCFGFIGANTKMKKLEEIRYETKRYKFYKKLIANYFGEKTFKHRKLVNSSAYLLLSTEALRSDCNKEQHITEMFQRNYSSIF